MIGKRIVSLIFAVVLLVSCLSSLAEVEWVAKITSTTQVYSSYSKSSASLGTLKKGTVLSLLESKNGWTKVKKGDNVGFVPTATIKKTTLTYYVGKGTMNVYESNNSDSKVIAQMGYGASVSLEAVNGSWARIVNGKNVGFCKYSSLVSKNPNTMSSTVYVQEDNVKGYALPSTSSASVKFDKNDKLTCVAIYDGDWCRVKSGSKYCYIKKTYLDTTKVNPYSTAKPASGKSKEMDWWTSGIQSIFARGTYAVVTDVATGISWTVYRGGGTNHADVQPKTAADTKAMKAACGSDYGTWNRRAIWVSINGHKYAASMNCKPHGEGSIKSNNFNGHHCIHFTNSRTHGTNSVCSLHQSAIKKALKAG